MESTVDLVFIKDYSNQNGRYIGCNNSFEEFVGKSKEEILNKDDIELFGDKIGEFFREKDFDVISKGNAISNEEWVTYPDGSKVLFHTLKSLFKDINGRVIGVLGVARDITETYNSQQKFLKQSKTLKESAKMISQNVIHSETDLNGIITKVSKAFCKISGYSKDELIGKSHNIVRHEDMPSSLYKDMWDTLKDGSDWSGEIKNKRKDGSYYWVDTHITPEFDDEKNIVGYFAIRHDITAKMDMKEINNQLEQSKHHFRELSRIDTLTGIRNRRAIFDDVKHISPDSAVLMLDIDDFKKINDTYGHDCGDVVIQHVVNTCQKCLRKEDVFGRLGGEEFVIVLKYVDNEKAKGIAERILKDVGEEKIGDKSIAVTLSIGMLIATKNSVNTSLSEALRDVDKLLYKAKELGKNQVRCDDLQ